MNFKRCNNGHFYNSDKFAACPHCQNANIDMKETEKLVETDMKETVYMPVTEKMHNNLTEKNVPKDDELAAAVLKAQNVMNIVSDDAKTVGLYSTEGSKGELAVGILLCVEGNDFGSTYLLKAGRNFIGRSNSMDVVIEKDTRVSRERHAVIVYDPKSRSFIAQPGNSSELFYINDKVVLIPEALKAYDEISLGNTKLIFLPICGENFAWEDYKK